MHQHLVSVGADGALAICAGYVNGFPGELDIFEQLGDALEAGLDHAAQTSFSLLEPCRLSRLTKPAMIKWCWGGGSL